MNEAKQTANMLAARFIRKGAEENAVRVCRVILGQVQTPQKLLNNLNKEK